MDHKEIKFPQDEGQHQNITEWWYLNGSLVTESGLEFSYMSTIFHVRYPIILGGPFKYIPSSDQYFYHGITTELATGKSEQHIEILDDNKAEVSEGKLNIRLTGTKSKNQYSLVHVGDNKYEKTGNSLTLTFESRKKPLLVGSTGIVDNVGEETYYYSLTSLDTEGTLDFGGESFKVAGKSWMDHQWGDFGAPKGYWNWFSIQLTGGIEVVCYEAGTRDGKKTLASISWSNGQQTSHTDISIHPDGEYWISPRTKARYPLSWKVTIPSAKAEFTIKAKVKDHEINFWYINYWEGPAEVEAIIDGKKIDGNGFIEIVGRHSKARRHGPLASLVLGQAEKYKYL